MAETPYYKFRLPSDVLADLNALAASNGGNNTTAVKESVTYWRRVVESAAAENAAALKPDDWNLLAALNDPDPFAGIDGLGEPCIDWSQRLAHELVGVWEGRTAVLPEHKAEAAACRKLAKRIGGWGVVRGYALFAALRHFWKVADSGVGGGEWWHPETWLTPTAKGDA